MAYWTDGTDERIFWGTGDGYLVAVDARTGVPVDSFGDHGRVDLMQGLPYAVRGSRDWLNALTYSVQSPPVVVRNTEEMLKLVPDELREASYALGIPKWKTILRIVVPTALAGIVTGIMLGIARVIGETAPLLILVGYSKSINGNLFDGFQGSLPTMIVNEATSRDPTS